MEHHFFHSLLVYLQQHPHIGELFAFLAAFAEALPLIGTVIPGSIPMSIVGILIGTAVLPGVTTLLIISAGAFIGDNIGFLIGYSYNERLRVIWPFRKHPKWLTMGEAFFEKHGAKSIFIGRFVAPARSAVPMIAGLLRCTWFQFLIAAIPSVVLWAIAYTLPGILLGALSREIPEADITRFFLYGIGVIASIWLIFWLIQHFFTQLTRAVNVMTDKLWRSLLKKPGCRAFLRLITNQQQPSDHHQLTLLVTALFSGILFLILLINVREQGVFTCLNQPFFYLLQSIRTPLFDTVFVIITIIGMPYTMLLTILLMMGSLVMVRQWRAAAHILLATLISAGTVGFVKFISHSPRPQGFHIVPHSSSFPSGHMTLSFVIFGLIAFFIAQTLKRSTRWVPYTLTGILITLIGFSRLYLGAHWLTDIVGGCLLGLFTLLLVIISYRRLPRKAGAVRLSQLDITLVLCISLLIPWGVNIPRKFAYNDYRYTAHWPTQHVSVRAWWAGKLQIPSIYRNNRLGKPFQPFNVQWQGSLSRITKTLTQQKWQVVSHHTHFKSALQRFVSLRAQFHMPLLPWLHHGKPPVIFMIKFIPHRKRILELRLWNSDFYFQQSDMPLWIGATDIRLPPEKLMSIKARAKISLEASGGLHQLYLDTKQFQHKMISVSRKHQTQKVKLLQWDGNVLLIR